MKATFIFTTHENFIVIESLYHCLIFRKASQPTNAYWCLNEKEIPVGSTLYAFSFSQFIGDFVKRLEEKIFQDL